MFHPSNEPAPRIAAFLTRAERPVLVAAALVSGVVLLFWLFPALRSLAPAGWSDMSLLTAVGILFLVDGAALTAASATPIARKTGHLAGIFVAALGATVIALDLAGVTTVGSYDLPSAQTSLAFVLLGIGLAYVRRQGPWVEYALLILWGFLFFMIGGHLFQSERMITSLDGRLISIQTVACFIAITLVLTGRRALGGGPFSIIVTRGMGSRITRVFLPIAIATPFVVFLLVQYLYSSELLPPSMTRAVISPIVAIGVVLLIGGMGTRINRLEKELHLQSVTDEMTGILNRRGFQAVSPFVVAGAQRSHESLTVYFFDLDGLKGINDLLGHKAGNLAIKTFARLLRSTFRHSDVMARVGGDEFAVLAAGDGDSATTALARLEKAVRQENTTGRHPFKIAFSVGFKVIGVSSDLSVDDALAHADGFMYDHKRMKKARDAGSMSGDATQSQPGTTMAVPDWSI